ncbi:hypothetical protein EYF80_035081 [Liparis tanakae]|uniref:Uncharacterized protein n=1 Tax=Liparis tanakae TaxID=230148 RepID=A0A4Z2GM34_9TELE|nr:hypothetical protein EYF80_035081 [Liparis tanakae]
MIGFSGVVHVTEEQFEGVEVKAQYLGRGAELSALLNESNNSFGYHCFEYVFRTLNWIRNMKGALACFHFSGVVVRAVVSGQREEEQHRRPAVQGNTDSQTRRAERTPPL